MEKDRRMVRMLKWFTLKVIFYPTENFPEKEGAKDQ
jgi:hypothetical protein